MRIKGISLTDLFFVQLEGRSKGGFTDGQRKSYRLKCRKDIFCVDTLALSMEASERGTLYPAQSGGAEAESRRECALRRAPKGFGSVARVFARGLHARAPVRSLELSNFR